MRADPLVGHLPPRGPDHAQPHLHHLQSLDRARAPGAVPPLLRAPRSGPADRPHPVRDSPLPLQGLAAAAAARGQGAGTAGARVPLRVEASRPPGRRAVPAERDAGAGGGLQAVLPEVLRDSSWLRDAALLAAARGGELELGDSLSQQLDAAWSGSGLAAAPREAVIVAGVHTPVAARHARPQARSLLVLDDASRFEDWRLRPEFVAAWLRDHPVSDLDAYRGLLAAIAEQRRTTPLVAQKTADRVVLDLVLNAVEEGAGRAVLDEARRVLRPAGVLALSIVLADEAPSALPLEAPQGLSLVTVPLESRLPELLRQAGWDAIRFAWRAELPLKVAGGVEFRLHLLEARKAAVSLGRDQGHAVIYGGPWQEVVAQDGARYVRGERTAVSDVT